ncbi:MAG: HIT family protein [Candidatus Diapherotrites archaeon]|nr:HIT family protein [Candidatus Diapherotrites archaeon]
MQACIFCRVIEGAVPSYKVWEGESFYAFLDINPVNPGHVLLIPKKHVDFVFDLDDDSYQGLFNAAKRLGPLLKKAMNSKRVGMAIEGFGVPHVHVHLVPVNHRNELNPLRARGASQEELKRVAALLQKTFA